MYNKKDKVTYTNGGKKEKGIVKSAIEDDPDNVFVVFNCGGEWDNYENYTAARTPVKYLSKGW